MNSHRSLLRRKKTKDASESQVYLSGPITGIPNFNLAAFTEAAALLKHNGFSVVNPLTVCPPDSSAFKPFKPWSSCMRADLIPMLKLCDKLVQLPDWQKSKGARLEYEIAKHLGFWIVEYEYLKLSLAAL